MDKSQQIKIIDTIISKMENIERTLVALDRQFQEDEQMMKDTDEIKDLLKELKNS